MNVQTEMANSCERQIDHQYNYAFNKLNAVMFFIILVLFLNLLVLFTVIYYAMELSVPSTEQSVCVSDSDIMTEMLHKYKPLLDNEQDSVDTNIQGTDTWSQQLAISITDQYQVTPAILNIKNESKNDSDFILGNPFFTFKEGHLMIMRVFPNGYGTGEGTHMSVVIQLMKGQHDDKLEQSGHWPLRGTFTIELLNQLNDSDHHSRMVQFHHHRCSECTDRVLEGDEANMGWGYKKFISHDTLPHHSNNRYHKSDYLMFRISYDDMEAPYQVAPVSFKVTKLSHWLRSEAHWYSSPFFAFEGGYKLHLDVDAAGIYEGEGTHVSVYLHLMKGPHDDELEQSGHWPLRGTFTVELLDQYNTSSRNKVYFFNNETCVECTNRVIHEDYSETGYGGRFISHHDLFNYYKSETLYFRVSYNSCYVCVYVYSSAALITLPALIIGNTIVIFAIIACTEICRRILKIRRVTIASFAIRYDLICSVLLKDTTEIAFIILALYAADILNRLIWEFTGIISYQSFDAIDDVIKRIGYVYFSSKAVYFYTTLHTIQTSVILSPIVLFVISNGNLVVVLFVLICNCIFNLSFCNAF